MNRHIRSAVLGAVMIGAVGCQSNPYRPTLFHKNRDMAGPEMSGDPSMMQEGPYLGSEANGNFPPPPTGAMPPGNYYPQPGAVPPPGQQAPPVQGFPQQMPPATNQLPQGPPPKTANPNTNGIQR